MSPRVEALLADISHQGHAYLSQVSSAKPKLLDAAVSLIAELETPVESITRIGWAEVVIDVSLFMLVD